MSFIPSAIIFVNNDLTNQVKSTLITQLFITEVMDGYEFDDRVTADPNYPTIVHNNKLNLLVIRPFTEITNRDLADVVIFVKAGLASIECNKYGPPGATYPVSKLHLNQIIPYGQF